MNKLTRLTRQQLELINRKTLQYPLQIAEKDYFLTLAIQIVYNSPLSKALSGISNLPILLMVDGKRMIICHYRTLPMKQLSGQRPFPYVWNWCVPSIPKPNFRQAACGWLMMACRA
jgi:hypothetical protein